jgi:hypothetical protein
MMLYDLLEKMLPKEYLTQHTFKVVKPSTLIRLKGGDEVDSKFPLEN